MKLFLGVDGGQSATTALIGDEAGQVLGSGAGGPCNHVGAAEGRAKLARTVRATIAAACADAGLPADCRFEAACFGMSGGAEDKRAVLAEVVATERLVVVTDADIALTGATSGAPGIITIAGTGSIALGRNAAGRVARAGGWGYIYGDEGGAFDIVRQALRAVLRHAEGWGPATTIADALLEATGGRGADDVLHLFYRGEWPRARVAALAPLVDQAAMRGDGVAVAILHNAAQQLAVLTGAVRQQLFDRGQAVRVAWIGGVFRSRILLERYRELVELADGSSAGPPDHGPAAGALLEAYRAAGVHPQLSGVPELK